MSEQWKKRLSQNKFKQFFFKLPTFKNRVNAPVFRGGEMLFRLKGIRWDKIFLFFLKGRRTFSRWKITIYDTVISSEAGDKVFEPGIFLFREVSRFF